MTGYRLSAEAEIDLQLIKNYLWQESGGPVARYVLREIRSALRFLVSTPGAGHRRDDLTDEIVKFWPVFSYLIVYDPETKPLAITRILHGSRDLSALLGR